MEFQSENDLDISIILPCLNEAATVADSVSDAYQYIQTHDLMGEVIVVDNGSTDGSDELARKAGAVVYRENDRGYGRAIRTGMEKSRGKVIVISDSDQTYDLLNLDGFVKPLLTGDADVVIGDRIGGRIEKGAMPFSHRIGVPALSLVSRIVLSSDVHDFHCGLRSITRDAAGLLDFHTNGMEFATEFIAEAAKKKLRIQQIQITLRCGPENRKTKLRTIRDGCRHLKYILSQSGLSAHK